MPLTDDVANSIGDIFTEVSSTLYDTGLKWFSTNDINNSIQDQYNKLVALLCPIEKSTFIPIQAGPYYNLTNQIEDFMYLSAIYNPQTNTWLRGYTRKEFSRNWLTYQSIGNPRFFNVVDFRRLLIWPYLNPAAGVLYIIYKARAPLISASHIPILPYSIASQMLEYSAIADLLEQAREFSKATAWWNKLFKPIFPSTRSIFDQAKLEIKALARNDRETVLEPYRWIFHGGQFNVATSINNETPAGTINGVNTIFTMAQVPNPSSSMILTRNGQVQIVGEAYTLVGTVITFNVNFIPQGGDVLRVWYQIQ